jgi:hypothetical protein
MDELLLRVLENLAARIGGPLTFRLILQPAAAVFFAVRDGRKDAIDGLPPYFWALFTEPEHRREMLRQGWQSIAKVFIMAAIVDVCYQVVVQRWVYPGEALIVAVCLACVPYVLVRGPVGRIGAKKGKSE